MEQLVKMYVEDCAKKMSQSNPMFVAARAGRLKSENIKFYLYNIMHLFQQTTYCLSLAEKRALELGEPRLAQFFQKKGIEEMGHDKWAQDDLLKFGQHIKALDEHKVDRSILDLMKYIRNLIHQDPKMYLLYMFFAEYFTVMLAPEFLSDLQNKCGIPTIKMSALAKHEQADRLHSTEGLEVIKDFIGTSCRSDEVLTVLTTSSQFIQSFFIRVSEVKVGADLST